MKKQKQKKELLLKVADSASFERANPKGPPNGSHVSSENLPTSLFHTKERCCPRPCSRCCGTHTWALYSAGVRCLQVRTTGSLLKGHIDATAHVLHAICNSITQLDASLPEPIPQRVTAWSKSRPTPPTNETSQKERKKNFQKEKEKKKEKGKKKKRNNI